MDKPKKSIGKRNKSAGHGWELKIIKILVERGLYEEGHVITCRAGSRRLDACGIDLMHADEALHGHMPDSIQAKKTTGTVSYIPLLARIKAAGRPNGVIFHSHVRRRGELFVEEGRYAITTMDRYLELMATEKFVDAMAKWIEDLPDPAFDFIRRGLHKLGRL